jgi:hypothetical protein
VQVKTKEALATLTNSYNFVRGENDSLRREIAELKGKIKNSLEKETEHYEIFEILRENYYTLGVTGAEAVASIWSEIADGQFVQQCKDWGITEKQLVAIVGWLAESLIDDGCWMVGAGTRDDR